MTFLSACQSAATRLIGRRPTTFFSSTDPFELEIIDLANEVAKDIAETNDWQSLITIDTLTGDGVQTAFPLPDDYDRMLLDSSIYDANSWAWGYSRITRVDDWLRLQVENYSIITPGMWSLFGDQLQFLPAPADASTAKFLYITKNIVRDEDDELKTDFTKDSDTFVLNERLLTLGLIWRWREQKKMDYGADQANFEKKFSEMAGKDGGSNLIIRNSRRPFGGRGSIGWPWPLGPGNY